MNGMFVHGRNELDKHMHFFQFYDARRKSKYIVLLFYFLYPSHSCSYLGNNMKHEGGQVIYFAYAPTWLTKQNGGSDKPQLLRWCGSASLEGICLV